MNKIVLFGASDDISLTLPLCRTLEKYGGVLYFGNSCAAEYGLGAPRFMVFESDRLDSLQIENAIVIFKTKQNEYSPKFAALDSTIAVADEENIPAQKFYTQFMLPCITCGMNAKNTITLSSINEDRAAISIQQNIKLHNGRELEPCEFSVLLSTRLEGYPLLATCAALILTEKLDEYIIKI